MLYGTYEREECQVPHININGAEIYYCDEGSGPETIVFSHGLLLDCSIFAEQIAALKDRYRCIAYDHRGQGASECTEHGLGMDALTEDAAGLIEALGVEPCHFAGLSMGGFVGLRLAMARPDLLKSLILINTSAASETFAKIWQYRLLNFIARNFGLNVVAGQVMPVMFGRTYLSAPDRVEERNLWRSLVVNNDQKTITRAVKGAINRDCVVERINAINHPTLIIAGEEDITTPPEKAREIHSRVEGSQLVVIPRAGHISTVEEPHAVSDAMDGFLAQL